jgi:hypothetical protein
MDEDKECEFLPLGGPCALLPLCGMADCIARAREGIRNFSANSEKRQKKSAIKRSLKLRRGGGAITRSRCDERGWRMLRRPAFAPSVRLSISVFFKLYLKL